MSQVPPLTIGREVWVFPDGEIPAHDPLDPAMKNDATHGHESLVVFNPTGQTVQPRLYVYFPDEDPWAITLTPIPAQRVLCYRTNLPLGEERRCIPHGKQYSLVLQCDGPVVAQIGRMDITQPNLAYYTVMGYPVG